MTNRKFDKMSGDASFAYARLAGDVARQILLTIARENKRPGGFTKSDLAALIGRDKGFITRSLDGARNLELRTIGAMLGAMGYVMDVKARPVRAQEEEHTNERRPATADVRISRPGALVGHPDRRDVEVRVATT